MACFRNPAIAVMLMIPSPHDNHLLHVRDEFWTFQAKTIPGLSPEEDARDDSEQRTASWFWRPP